MITLINFKQIRILNDIKMIIKLNQHLMGAISNDFFVVYIAFHNIWNALVRLS